MNSPAHSPLRLFRGALRRALPLLLMPALCLLAQGSDEAAPAGTLGVEAGLEARIQQARDRVYPALVNIQPVRDEYVGGKKVQRTATGSGVIFDTQGHAVTNYHVAGKAKKLIVTLSNKEKIHADLVGGDPWTDIAVIKLRIEEYKGTEAIRPAAFGRSALLVEGDFVMAMGSPLALARSISFGVVSCRDRALGSDMELEDFQRTGSFNTWIQTDAAINPGNSGGPMVNLAGEVVGINARGNSGANNIGFAIPIDIVKEVIDQILKTGTVTRSWIGAEWQPIDQFEEHFQVSGGRGVLLGHVIPGGPAAKAGLQPGDILLTYDGAPVSARFTEQLPDLEKRIADTPVGKEVSLHVLRGGTETELTLTTIRLEEGAGEDYECKAWEFTVKGITSEMARDLKLEAPKGVLVTGSQAAGDARKAGLDNGDVLLEVGGKPVGSLEEFIGAYEQFVDEKRAKVLIKILKSARTQRLVVLEAEYEKKSDEKRPEEAGTEGKEN
ncbi:MAG: trypsin-like peptidase domain-containing protein [Planctomycetes bacterium]|nr:trypsin-like peptidase domain-containing protein [Planctomycetota bacterium]